MSLADQHLLFFCCTSADYSFIPTFHIISNAVTALGYVSILIPRSYLGYFSWYITHWPDDLHMEDINREGDVKRATYVYSLALE